MSISTLPCELLHRVLFNVSGRKALHRLRTLSRIFAQTIENDHFRAKWLLIQYGPRSLAIGIAIQLHPAYPWPLTEASTLFLISRGADPCALRGLPLVWAASLGLKTVLNRLLDACKPSFVANSKHPWPNIILRQYHIKFWLPVPTTFSSESPIDLALQSACGAGHIDLAQSILQRFSVNVNATNSLALRFGVASGNIDLVKLLLSAGGDVVDIEKLLLLCLGSLYQINNVQIRENRRVLFHMLLKTQDAADTLVRQMTPTRYKSMIWWPAVEQVSKHYGKFDAANLAIKMLLEGRIAEANAFLLKLAQPHSVPIARTLQITDWILNPTIPFLYDHALAFAVNSELKDSALLVQFLLAHDYQCVFRSSWVIQLARSEYHQSGEALQVLDEHGLTCTIADAVFYDFTSLQTAWAEYAAHFPVGTDLCLCLALSLRNRIILKDMRAAVLLTELGARGEVDIKTYFEYEWGEVLNKLRKQHEVKEQADELPRIGDSDHHTKGLDDAVIQSSSSSVRPTIGEQERPDPRVLAILLGARAYQLDVVRALAELPPVVLLRLFHEGAISFKEWGVPITAAASELGHWRTVRAVLWVPEFRESFRVSEHGGLSLTCTVQNYKFGGQPMRPSVTEVLQKYT